MDDIIISVFTGFAFLIFFLGFWRKQNILVLFSGISFSLLGIFIYRGIQYKASTTMTQVNSSVTQFVYNYSTWYTSYRIELLIFLMLFGIFLIWISAFEYLKAKQTSETKDLEDDD